MGSLRFARRCWVWKSIRPEENRYRFYSLSVQRDLWGKWGVVRCWGRIGGGSKERYLWPEREEEVQDIFRAVHQSRLRHGYTLVRGSIPPS